MESFFSDGFLLYVVIFAIGAFGYIISTLAGGRGFLLLVPAIGFLIGGKATAPAVNFGN